MCSPRREIDRGLRLARAEVEMVEVVRDRLIERRQVRVDQHMVMSRVRPVRTGRGDAHVAQPEVDRELRGDVRAVLEVREIERGARRRCGRAALRHDVHRDAL